MTVGKLEEKKSLDSIFHEKAKDALIRARFTFVREMDAPSFAVASGAVSKPGGDAAGQDALHSAGVEGSEDAGARSKLPQPSQEEEALMCLLQHCVCVSRPCEILGDVNAKELKAVYPLYRCLVDGDGCVFCALSPEIHQLVLSMLSERWFS